MAYFNDEVKELLYLKLIEKIIFARFLELDEEKLKEIRNALSKFIRSNNEEIAAISKRIKNKLYKYKGVKCPDHLIFISLLSEKDAQLLTDYTIDRYFEVTTNKNALKLAYQGRLGIIPEGNEALARFYQSNPFYSSPLIIRPQKRGYISFILEYLKENGYVTHDNIWDSIARHKYFKSRKKYGTIEFVTSNEFSQSLSYKKQRLFSTNNKSKDRELEQLNSFLTNNFKKRSTT